MNSINRKCNPCCCAQVTKGTTSVSEIPLTETALIRMFSKPALIAASIPARTLSRASLRVISLNLSRSMESRLTLMRSSPLAFNFSAWSLNKIPLVRSIYSGVKQVSSTIFDPSGKSFSKVVMLQYPKNEMIKQSYNELIKCFNN